MVLPLAAALQIFRNIGVYSTDDCLRFLRQNPIGAAAGGDVRMVQGAMIALTALLPEETDPETSETDADEGDAQPFNWIVPAYRAMVRNAVGRILNRKEPTGDYVRAALKPFMCSMAQALVALRYGTPGLTKNDEFVIDAELAAIARGAAAWQKADAGTIAHRVTDRMYKVLAKEILE